MLVNVRYYGLATAATKKASVDIELEREIHLKKL